MYKLLGILILSVWCYVCENCGANYVSVEHAS